LKHVTTIAILPGWQKRVTLTKALQIGVSNVSSLGDWQVKVVACVKKDAFICYNYRKSTT
jgi:hypothetical protein